MATYHDIRYSTPLTNGGAQILLKKISVSDGDSTLTFSVLPFSFKEYIITHLNYKSSTDGEGLAFQGTTDGTNFNTTITSTTFAAYHDEGDSFALLEYRPNADQAQGTALQPLNYADSVGTDNDMCFVGTLHLFDPSNTTFVKHFISTCNSASQNPMPTNTFIAGYFNTTSAITGIRFQQNTGNIDIGTIKMYGVS